MRSSGTAPRYAETSRVPWRVCTRPRAEPLPPGSEMLGSSHFTERTTPAADDFDDHVTRSGPPLTQSRHGTCPMPVLRCWCLPSRCRLLVFRKLRERHKKTTDEDGLPPATPAAECAIALVVVESLRNSFCLAPLVLLDTALTSVEPQTRCNCALVAVARCFRRCSGISSNFVGSSFGRRRTHCNLPSGSVGRNCAACSLDIF